MDWRGGNHVIPVDFREDHLPEEEQKPWRCHKCRWEHCKQFGCYWPTEAETDREESRIRRDELRRDRGSDEGSNW